MMMGMNMPVPTFRMCIWRHLEKRETNATYSLTAIMREREKLWSPLVRTTFRDGQLPRMSFPVRPNTV